MPNPTNTNATSRSIAPAGGDDDEAAGIDLAWLLDVLRRRWSTALVWGAFTASLLVAGAVLLPGSYKVRGLAQLGLATDHDPTRSGRDAAFTRRVFDTHRGLLTSDGVVDDALRRLGRAAGPDENADQVRKDYLDHLTITPIEGTFLVSVEASGPDAEDVAKQANALMDAWLPFTNRFLGSDRTRERELAAKEQRLTAQRAQLAARHPDVAERGARSLGLRREAILERQRLVREKQTAALVEQSRAESERDRVRDVLAQVGVERSPERFLALFKEDSDRAERARALFDLRSRIEDMKRTIRPERLASLPEYSTLTAKLEVEDRAFRDLLQAQARSELVAVEARAVEHAKLGQGLAELHDRLTRELRETDAALAVATPIASELAWFDAEVERTRGELRRLQSERLGEGAAIVDRAEPADTERKFPLASLPLIALAALAMGVACALLAERTDGRVRGVERLALLGRPVLGQVPHLDLELLDEAGQLRESKALPQVRARLAASLPRDARTVLVCAAGPAEGCTLSALVLAQAMASRGPTLLLDHGTDRRAAQVLAGEGQGGEVETACAWAPGLTVRATDFPERALSELGDKAGTVIVDGGSVLGGAARLAHRVDVVLLVVRLGVSRLRDVQRALDVLGDVPLALVVDDVGARDDLDLSQVGLRSPAQAVTHAAYQTPAATLNGTVARPPSGALAARLPGLAGAAHGSNGGTHDTLAGASRTWLGDAPGADMGLPRVGPTDLLAGPDGGLDPERLSILERQLMRLQGLAGRSAEQGGVSEDEVRRTVRDVLRELGGDAGVAGAVAAVSNDRFDNLERRMGKVSNAMEELEKLMGMVAAAAASGGGMPSMFKDFMGLNANDPRFEKKNGLLTQIFDENVDLQGEHGKKMAGAGKAKK